jgi:DNA-binding transcriptional regulator PaaX
VTARSSERRRYKAVSDVVVLAAVDRAERHDQTEGITWRRLLAHLDFVHTGWTTRSLSPQVDALTKAGSLKRGRRSSSDTWGLTSKGRRRLAQARRAGEVNLPEAPQHQQWRLAHAEAANLIEDFRERLRCTLDEAGKLLDSGRGDSDAWFAIAKRLEVHATQVARATYRLVEWAEPDDADADIDAVPSSWDGRHLRRGSVRESAYGLG